MSFNSSISMSASVERGLIKSHTDFVHKCLGHLNEKGVLKCTLDEAIEMFDFNAISLVSKRGDASKKSKPSVKKTKSGDKSDLISKLVEEASNELFGVQPVSEDGNESDSSVASTQSKKEAKEAAKLAKAEAKETAKLAKAQAKETAKLAKAQEKEAAKLAKAQEKEAAELAKAEAKEADKLAKAEAKEAAKLDKVKAKAEAKEAAKLAKAEAKEAAKLAKKATKHVKAETVTISQTSESDNIMTC